MAASMNEDTDAVGGFFEDLPVLAFVLAGVMSVASTASWSAEQLSEDRVSEDLLREAERVLDAALDAFGPLTSSSTVEHLRQANLSGLAGAVSPGIGWTLSVWVIHPSVEELVSVGQLEGGLSTVRSAKALVNAISDDGAVYVLEVRAVVWPAEER